MYKLYRLLIIICGPLIPLYLSYRKRKGKESERSIVEKTCLSFSIERPNNSTKLVWLHGASVGEAQSSLILINSLLKNYETLQIIVTTGTLTSAKLMEERLPERAFHQFCPLDHPKYIKKFIDYWRPDYAIWMESELWPNTLNELRKQNIPSTLVNAHMSPKSFKYWSYFPSTSKKLLSTFDKILCQSNADKELFDLLGAKKTIATDNIKYSAEPLSYIEEDLSNIQKITSNRKVCLYASTHDGEEELACAIHKRLKQRIPELLTIIVPRHPERRDEIAKSFSDSSLNISFRGGGKTLPSENDDIYIADTLGELGLFYALTPIAYIGRSMSNDGGGGHNPIEAAQYGCAIVHGPNTQNLQDIYRQMHTNKASITVSSKDALENALCELLENENHCATMQSTSSSFAKNKTNVIKKVMKEVSPYIE